MRKDGWVVDDNSNLLIWVPQDLHDALMQPSLVLELSHRGYVNLDFDNALLGELWTGCYEPA